MNISYVLLPLLKAPTYAASGPFVLAIFSRDASRVWFLAELLLLAAARMFASAARRRLNPYYRSFPFSWISFPVDTPVLLCGGITNLSVNTTGLLALAPTNYISGTLFFCILRLFTIHYKILGQTILCPGRLRPLPLTLNRY